HLELRCLLNQRKENLIVLNITTSRSGYIWNERIRNQESSVIDSCYSRHQGCGISAAISIAGDQANRKFSFLRIQMLRFGFFRNCSIPEIPYILRSVLAAVVGVQNFARYIERRRRIDGKLRHWIFLYINYKFTCQRYRVAQQVCRRKC